MERGYNINEENFALYFLGIDPKELILNGNNNGNNNDSSIPTDYSSSSCQSSGLNSSHLSQASSTSSILSSSAVVSSSLWNGPITQYTKKNTFDLFASFSQELKDLEITPVHPNKRYHDSLKHHRNVKIHDSSKYKSKSVVIEQKTTEKNQLLKLKNGLKNASLKQDNKINKIEIENTDANKTKIKNVSKMIKKIDDNAKVATKEPTKDATKDVTKVSNKCSKSKKKSKGYKVDRGIDNDSLTKYYHCGLEIDMNKKDKEFSLFELTVIQSAIWRKMLDDDTYNTSCRDKWKKMNNIK